MKNSICVVARCCAAAAGLLLAAGCGQSPPAPQPPPAAQAQPEKDKSAVETVVDGITGKTAVEAGKKARSQLEQIGKQEQGAVDEILKP